LLLSARFHLTDDGRAVIIRNVELLH
jgi:hypothetical protein